MTLTTFSSIFYFMCALRKDRKEKEKTKEKAKEKAKYKCNLCHKNLYKDNILYFGMDKVYCSVTCRDEVIGFV